MEFFVWCWIWDKRLLCGLNHGRALFIYLWLVPMIISIGVLPYALTKQIRQAETREECDKVAEVKEYGDLLRTFIFIEEGILCLSILTSLGMIVKTRSIFNQLIMRQKGALCLVAPEFDYNWQVRDLSLKSCIGYLTLVVSMSNFACSIGYIYLYFHYTDLVAENNLDSNQCEFASAWAILSYCILFQATLGTLCCLIYILSGCLKTCHAIGFICPIITTRIKKCCLKIPRDFGHYQNEFNFECDESFIVIAQDPPEI